MSKTELPGVKFEPRCKRCGTSVDKGVQFCPVCQEIMDAKRPPKATVEVGKQPEPAYQDAPGQLKSGL